MANKPTKILNFLPSHRYTITVQSISPSKGGTAGGTAATIKGNGFGDVTKDLSVLLDYAECTVTSVNMSTILCVTSTHVEANVSVNVSKNLFSLVFGRD